MGEVQRLAVHNKVVNVGSQACDICGYQRADCIAFSIKRFLFFDIYVCVCDSCVLHSMKMFRSDAWGDS